MEPALDSRTEAEAGMGNKKEKQIINAEATACDDNARKQYAS